MRRYPNLALLLGGVVALAAGAWWWSQHGLPKVTIAGRTSTLSMATHTCVAPDTNGALQGARTCLTETFVLEPTTFLVAGPHEQLRVSLDGASYDYALVRVKAARARCHRAHTFRLSGSARIWTTPGAPGRYAVRLVFDRAGDSGTATALFGLIVGNHAATRPAPTQFCPT